MPHIKHVYYEEAGAGRPVLFLHCPALSHVYWRPIIEHLKDECRCIAMDIRGHGQSGLGDIPWTFTDIAADVSLLTERLHLDRPVLVGYSSGATIAMKAVIDQPLLYGGLVVIGGFPECSTLSLRVKAEAGLMAANLGLTRLIGPAVIHTNNTGPQHTRAMLTDAKRLRPEAIRSFFKETRRSKLTALLGQIRIPTLLVYGAKDDSMHGYYRQLREGLPHSQSILFPGVDHRVPTRIPRAFAIALGAFLAGIEESPAGEERAALSSLDQLAPHQQQWPGQEHSRYHD